MRLQKQKTRKVNGKEYFRWTIVIPPGQVARLGWKAGEELKSRVKKGKLLFRKKESS